MKTTRAAKSPERRRRNPDRTHRAIIESAGTLLAQYGPAGLSVSEVARHAGVSRGAAYRHFRTRQQLLRATTAWVSENLRSAVFGESESIAVRTDRTAPERIAGRLAEFAMTNPELGRIWLFEVLKSNRPFDDSFWHQYKSRFENFARSRYAQPGIDGDVHSVLMVAGALLWPVWVRAHARTATDRQAMAKRYCNEVLRLSMYGSMRPNLFPEIDAKLRKSKSDQIQIPGGGGGRQGGSAQSKER